MSFPIIVDIAIGLVFIYLLLSLLASEIQELIATILQWRAKHLKDSITNLFAGDAHSDHSVEKAHQLAKQVYQHPLIRGINQESRGFLPNLFRGITWLFSRLYRLAAGKKEGEFGDRRTAPSYIPREAFATALLEQMGTKYFVERLVEAKFSDFVASILDKVSVEESIKYRAGYLKLKKNLESIEQEFISNRIDLNSAVQSIVGKLDIFLEEMRGQLQTETLEELKDWRNRVFLDDELERTIKNAGLNPTLQEIVDSIDKNSKTYRTYKERFRRYEQERFQEVRRDLRYFEDFLLVFLKGMLAEETPRGLRASDLENAIAHILTDLKELDELFFKDVSSDTPEYEQGDRIRRTKTPISQVDQIVLEKLVQLEKQLDPRIKNGATKKLRHSIHAFQEGFAGKNFLSDLRYLPIFKELITSKIVPFFLLFLLGFLIAVVLSDITLPENLSNLNQWQTLILAFRNLLIGRSGGIIAIAVLVGLPFLWFTFFRWFFNYRRRQRCTGPRCEDLPLAQQDINACKTLAEIFDDYLAEEIPPALSEATLATDETDHALARAEFSDAIAVRLERLSEESDAQLFDEVKDLGRSFRRYYLRFILENADVDLPFIPNSVKQSLAVLIRRSKTSAKQAEDQIIHLKAEVEAWYDRSMDRASGVYRRNAKGISIMIGILLAIAVNANSIHILDQLAFEEELRLTLSDTVRRSFINTVESQGDEAEIDQLVENFREDISPALDEINLPIGWDPYLIDSEFGCDLPKEEKSSADRWHTLIQHCIDKAEGAAIKTPELAEPPRTFFYPTAVASIFLQQPLVGLRYLLGWIITGIAISMGASFWFDLLGKLVNVRNTGKPIPASSKEKNVNDVSASTIIKDE